MPEISSVLSALSQCPALIQEEAKKVVEATTAHDRAKRAVEKARAMAIINHQNAKNQMVLSALVDNDPAVDEAEAAVTKAKGDYLSAVAAHERQKDEFDSAKKQANLLEAEMRSFPR